MSDIVLKTIELTKRYKNRVAVDHLTIAVHRGEIFGFLGPNGAGKSTTIRMILHLVFPTEGDVEIFGQSLRKVRHGALARVEAVVEKPAFYNHLSALRNLEILGGLQQSVSRRRIMEMLERVGLADRANDPVKAFSHGMNQRLGLALILLNEPELVILDEPTTGLDPQGMKEVRQLILELSRQRGVTIFLSSHKIQGKINMPTIRVPDFAATLYFKKPDRFHIETKRFAPIPRNSGVFNPFQFDPEKNLFAYLRTETADGRITDVYRVEPIDSRTPVRYYTVWLGGAPIRVLQVESISFQGTKAVVTIGYQSVSHGADQWLLPQKIHIHLVYPEGAKGPDSLINSDSCWRRRRRAKSGGVVPLRFVI
jgi:ABC-type Na+ transport system ATPase subunit NatA